MLADARAGAQASPTNPRTRGQSRRECRKALDAKLNAQIGEAEKTIAARRSSANDQRPGHRGRCRRGHRRAPTGSATGRREVEAAVVDVLKR